MKRSRNSELKRMDKLQKGKDEVIRFRGNISTPVVSILKVAIESKNNNYPVSNVQET